MTTKDYLVAIQDEAGREVCSATATGVEKVSDITTNRDNDHVGIFNGVDELLVEAPDPGGALYLHRWPADDKLAKPVTHKLGDQ